jgi:hypothetical protein
MHWKRELPFRFSSKLFFFVAAQKFVALDGGNYADGAFVARLCALDAAEAAYTNGPCQCDFVGQGEKNFNGRAFLYIFLEEEVDTAGTDIPGFGAGLTNRRSRSPTNGEGQPHGKR